MFKSTGLPPGGVHSGRVARATPRKRTRSPRQRTQPGRLRPEAVVRLGELAVLTAHDQLQVGALDRAVLLAAAKTNPLQGIMAGTRYHF